MEDKKVIYSRRYEDCERERRLKEYNFMYEEDEDDAKHEYIPIEERIALRDDYIELAIEFSKTFCVDVDIIDENDYVAVRYYFYALALIDFSKELFRPLFAMADSIIILAAESGCNKSVVELTYITHEIK